MTTATRNRVRLAVANDALLASPIRQEAEKRRANWLAVIGIDASMPSGLSRRFANRGRGECLYVLEQVGLFDAVEFGSDYTTSYGDKRRDRWYGVVVASTESFIELEQAPTGVAACLRARELATSAAARAEALRIEKDALLERAAKLEAEIEELGKQPETPSSGA